MVIHEDMGLEAAGIQLVGPSAGFEALCRLSLMNPSPLEILSALANFNHSQT